MKTVSYKNYTVTKFKSGTIEATKNGQIASPTEPLLRELAKELDVNNPDPRVRGMNRI